MLEVIWDNLVILNLKKLRSKVVCSIKGNGWALYLTDSVTIKTVERSPTGRLKRDLGNTSMEFFRIPHTVCNGTILPARQGLVPKMSGMKN